MYGLIHNSLRAMVKAELGNEAWAEIVEAAGVSEQDFLSLKSYDDSIVLSLLDATHSKTGRSVNDLLYDFGWHFIKHTAFGHYSSVLNTHGSSLWELLDNLNHMHDRIASTFPDYSPPSFLLLEAGDDAYELIYSSTRQGLTSFVQGLIAALAAHYAVVIEIEILEDSCSDQGQQTRFRLTAVCPA